MRRNRQFAASVLLVVLTVGGLLAPLSHLVYMAVSDHYAPASAHAGRMAHANDHPGVQAPVVGHLSCPYLDLFATPLVGDTNTPLTVQGEATRVTVLRQAPYVIWHNTSTSPYEVRGPPTCTSLV